MKKRVEQISHPVFFIQILSKDNPKSKHDCGDSTVLCF